MTVAGVNASEILTHLRTRLAGVEGVAFVGRGTPTTEDQIGALPSVFVRYAGSQWDSTATRHYRRIGSYQIVLFTGGREIEEAEDSMFLLTDRIKAFIRENEDMAPAPGRSYAYRALVQRDGPVEPVNSEEGSILRTVLQLEIHWLERFTSEVGSDSLGVIG